MQKKHKSSAEVKEEVDHLVEKWTQLVLDAENHSRGLEEAQDILEFNTQVEKVDAWIRDKVSQVSFLCDTYDIQCKTSFPEKLSNWDYFILIK